MAYGKRCFVTVGATASFSSLLEEVLSKEFIDYLSSKGFTELLVQTGPDQDWALNKINFQTSNRIQEEKEHKAIKWPVIEAFSYTTDVTSKMIACRGKPGQWLPGAMISHAGSGSILDASRMDVPLIVVPNRNLLGNHQEELADAVQAAGWAVKGELGNLKDAINRVLDTTDKQSFVGQDLYHEPKFPTTEEERCGLFDWAAMEAGQDVFLDETRYLQLD